MPGAWDSTSSITLPDEIALNYEDKNKKLGEGNAFRGFLPKKTSLSFKCLQRRLYKDTLHLRLYHIQAEPEGGKRV